MRLPLLILFSISLLANIYLVVCVNQQGILTDEETTISFLNIFLLPYRIQHDHWCSNWGNHVIMWFMQKIFGDLGLFYGRYAKAFMLALAGPLLFILQTRHMKLRPSIAFGTSLFFCLLPGVVNFAWLALENGVETVLGTSALIFALSADKRQHYLAVFLASFAALTYGAGLTFIPVVFFLIGIRLRGHFGALLILALAVISLPLFWWKNASSILLGSGSISSWAQILGNGKDVFIELFHRGGSYYYFSDFPAFSSLFFLPLVIVGFFLALSQKQYRWLIVGLGAALGVYIFSGNSIGIRRGIPILLFLTLHMALAVDYMLSADRPLSLRRAALFMLACFMTIPLTQYRQTSQLLSHVQLPVNFQFPLEPGMSMLKTYEVLLKNPEYVENTYEPDRTYVVLYYLSAGKIFNADFALQKMRRIERPIN